MFTMENHITSTEVNSQRQTRQQLKQLIDQLLQTVIPVSVQRRNLIINDVPPGLPITTDENLVALVMGNLLQMVIDHTEDDCVRVGIVPNSQLSTISMKNNSLLQNKSFILALETIQVIAQRMGGVISIDKQESSHLLLVINFQAAIKAA